MTGKLLQFLGVAAILAMLGATIAGFAVLKDRVRIVVQSDEARAGPDPTALLRDDVAVLGERLQGLQQAVANNFEKLADGLEQAARGRAQAADADRAARLDALREELREELRSLSRQVAALQQRLDAESAAPAIAESTEPPVEAAAPESAHLESVDVDPSPAEPLADESPRSEPERESEPAPAKPERTGFLSFSLPKAKRVFDEPQTYRLLPDLCRVGFDAKSTLHDFTGVTTDVAGSFRADFDDPDGLCTGEVLAKADTLITGVEERDENMYEHLDTANHRQIRFAIEKFVADDGGVDVDARTASGKVVGKMSIRGKTRELSMPVSVEVDAQQRLVVTGQTKLKLSDYEVPVPSQLGVINMEDEVAIWIALRARPQGDAK